MAKSSCSHALLAWGRGNNLNVWQKIGAETPCASGLSCGSGLPVPLQSCQCPACTEPYARDREAARSGTWGPRPGSVGVHRSSDPARRGGGWGRRKPQAKTFRVTPTRAPGDSGKCSVLTWAPKFQIPSGRRKGRKKGRTDRRTQDSDTQSTGLWEGRQQAGDRGLSPWPPILQVRPLSSPWPALLLQLRDPHTPHCDSPLGSVLRYRSVSP